MTHRGDWFCTASGRQVYILDPAPEDICIVDIAHALANTCRFGGHVDDFYSVAQHSVLVSRMVPEDIALAGLLHDAAEAYLGDVIHPLKISLPDYRAIEALWEACIISAFDLTVTEHAKNLIKVADRRALITERRDVAPDGWSRFPWKADEQGYRPFSERIEPLPPKAAKSLFLTRWYQLTRK